VSDAIPVLTDRKSLLSEDSLLERVIAAAEERQLSIHSSPQPAHNRVSTGSRRIADTSLAMCGWSAFESEEPASGRRRLLPIKELSGGPTGPSLASRPGSQSWCGSASSLTGLAPGWAMNGEPKAKKARSNDCLRQLQAIRVRHLENRRSRPQAFADPDPT
jgi:hypothetical protein